LCPSPSEPLAFTYTLALKPNSSLQCPARLEAGWWLQSSVPAYLQIQSRPSQRPTSFNNNNNNNKSSTEGEQTLEFASRAIRIRNSTTTRHSGLRFTYSTPYLPLRIICHHDVDLHPSIPTNFSGIFCHVLTNNGYESVRQPQPLLLFTFLLAAIIPRPRRTRLAICRLSLVSSGPAQPSLQQQRALFSASPPRTILFRLRGKPQESGKPSIES
jgi:hypothetical protein